MPSDIIFAIFCLDNLELVDDVVLLIGNIIVSQYMVLVKEVEHLKVLLNQHSQPKNVCQSLCVITQYDYKWSLPLLSEADLISYEPGNFNIISMPLWYDMDKAPILLSLLCKVISSDNLKTLIYEAGMAKMNILHILAGSTNPNSIDAAKVCLD